jgi:hypothetical protein
VTGTVEKFLELHERFDGFALSPTGSRISVPFDSQLKVFDVATESAVFTLDFADGVEVCFSRARTVILLQ